MYGNGTNIRDWVFVSDNCQALFEISRHGKSGEKYNVGGGQTISNLMLAQKICSLLDTLRPKEKGSYKDQICFVEDRKGHDFRYAVNFSKIKTEFGWSPKVSFDEGLAKTIGWYLGIF